MIIGIKWKISACTLLPWWFWWSLVIPCPLWRCCPVWCCVLLFESFQRLERGPWDDPYIFLQNFCLFPLCIPCCNWLITSVPVDYLPFMDDVVFVLGCYQEFCNSVGTFEMSLYSCFAAYVSKTLSQAFGIWDYYEGVVVSVIDPM